MRKFKKIDTWSDSTGYEIGFYFEDEIFHKAIFKRDISLMQVIKILKKLHDDIAFDINLFCDKGAEIIGTKEETEQIEKEIKELILKLYDKGGKL